MFLKYTDRIFCLFFRQLPISPHRKTRCAATSPNRRDCVSLQFRSIQTESYAVYLPPRGHSEPILLWREVENAGHLLLRRDQHTILFVLFSKNQNIFPRLPV